MTRVFVTINGNNLQAIRKNKTGIFPLIVMAFQIERTKLGAGKLHDDGRSTARSRVAGQKISTRRAKDSSSMRCWLGGGASTSTCSSTHVSL